MLRRLFLRVENKQRRVAIAMFF